MILTVTCDRFKFLYEKGGVSPESHPFAFDGGLSSQTFLIVLCPTEKNIRYNAGVDSAQRVPAAMLVIKLTPTPAG